MGGCFPEFLCSPNSALETKQLPQPPSRQKTGIGRGQHVQEASLPAALRANKGHSPLSWQPGLLASAKSLRQISKG